MKLKNKDIKDMATKLNELAELEDEEQFDPKQDVSELKEDLRQALTGEGTDDGEPEIEVTAEDDFTDHEWKVLAELGCPAALEEGEEEESGSGEEEGDDLPEEEGEEGGEEEEGEEGDEEELTYEDLQAMTKKKDLKEVIEDNDLETDPKNYKKVDELREAIAEELGFTESEEEEGGEEEGGEEEGGEEGLTYEDLEKMTKKKDLKTVVEEYELEVDTSQKVADLRQEIAEKLELVAPEEEEGGEEGELTLEDLNAMTKKKDLKEVITDNDLETDPADYKKVDDLRQAIAEELGFVEEEGEEEQEEEAPEPPSYDDLQAMTKKKDLKQVVEDHELDVDTSQKVAELRESIASALGVAPKKSKKSESKGKKSEGKGKKSGDGDEYKGTTKERVEFLTPLIKKGTYTKKELLEKAQEKFPGASRQALQTLLTDAKNPNYNKFAETVVQDDEKRMMFESAGKKNKSAGTKKKKK